ncbi:MAG: 2,3-bisphosphoglycerate-independent phosphoglycerate mutase [Syntrophomonadaceae bacterium]|nr:2,3-bisphosphoglycerate-independent phosphoglycerate mutase [Syntrophomonadaceae bacterium]
MILDGWGVRAACADNAICNAPSRNFDRLLENYPHTLLHCCGREVGLPDGQMGNSEVGHLNIGAGRIVWQEITRISNAIADGSFFSNPTLLQAADYARQHGGAVHLMGLLSDGGVHSEMEHLFALLRFCRQQGIKSVYIHAYLDGRDVAPKSALTYIKQLQDYMQALGLGEIATLGGRYYGMDRDKHWERVEPAWRAMVLGEGPQAIGAAQAVQAAYEAGLTDEFMPHTVLTDAGGSPVATIKDHDSVIFFNFRADRARQISHVFTDSEFVGFERPGFPQIYYACMTEYDVTLQADTVFPAQNLNNTLGEVLSRAGIRQLRMAETEKYAHVTFFFNGGVEAPNPGEDRILIPSPAVSTYDLQPEMSAPELTQRLLTELQKDYYDVVVINFANPDMVGHTGVYEAAVRAVVTVDQCLQRIVDAVLARQGTVLITADHGNCEQMRDSESGGPFTAHTCNPVPLVLVGERHQGKDLRSGGSLRDIAPTMLKLLDLPQPFEMTGESLVK